MRTLIRAMALAGAVAGPAVAQDAPAPDAAASDTAASDTMTCGEFVALNAEGQMSAMLALRASYNGEPVDEPSDVTADEGTGGDDPATSPRLTGMRTACEGVPDALALDAMLAAHADYE